MRYSAVSAIAVGVGQVAIVGFFYFAHWSARPASVGSCVVAGIPSYYLNRRWVWSKQGRSKITGELMPFFALTLLGLAGSTWLAGLAESYGERHLTTRSAQTALVSSASLAAFGSLWILKFVFFNRVLFAADSPQDSAEGSGADRL